MNKNLERFIFLLIIAIVCASSISAQNAHRFSLNIATGMSKTGSLAYSEQYRESEVSSTISIRDIRASRNNNYNFSIGFQPTKSISLNGSIGVASYGFRYIGDVTASPINFISVGGIISRESYSTRLMEVGLSTSYRIAGKNDLFFIIQPGLAWYTNPREEFSQLLGIYMKGNNFSATLFTGIELPLVGNAFFVSVGLNTKIALGKFNRFFDFENTFLPYAVGLQATISYRFWSFSNI